MDTVSAGYSNIPADSTNPTPGHSSHSQSLVTEKRQQCVMTNVRCALRGPRTLTVLEASQDILPLTRKSVDKDQ